MADAAGFYLFPGEPQPRRMRFREKVNGESATDCLATSDEDWASIGVTRHDRPDFDPDTHKVTWDGSAWKKTALTAAQKAAVLDAAKAEAKARVTGGFHMEIQQGITVAAAGGAQIRADDVGQGQITRLKEKTAGGGSQKIVTRAGAAVEASEALATAIHSALSGYISEMEAAEYDAYVAIDALTTPADCRAYTPSWPTRVR